MDGLMMTGRHKAASLADMPVTIQWKFQNSNNIAKARLWLRPGAKSDGRLKSSLIELKSSQRQWWPLKLNQRQGLAPSLPQPLSRS
jgi:hypothetical protein